MQLYRAIEMYHKGRKPKKKQAHKAFADWERKPEDEPEPQAQAQPQAQNAEGAVYIQKTDPNGVKYVEKQEVETHPRMREPRRKKKVGRALIIG